MTYEANIALDTWYRYQYLRDNGHNDYVAKAKQCEDFFANLQWSQEDLAKLKASRRPALTINKILSTVSNVLGEQIFNRMEIAFRPKREGASEAIADTLTKVFSHIGDQNQLEWVRSDVFADGLITSRGFYDARIQFTDSLRGEVSIIQLNPKNVLPDADAEEYDPDTWSDVIITKWMSPDQISLLYGKQYGDALRGKATSGGSWGYGDTPDMERDRFGPPRMVTYGYASSADAGLDRSVRVLERQYRSLHRVNHFVDLRTGDMRAIPEDWDRNMIAYVMEKYGLGTSKKLVDRIKWCVVADDIVLHESWSPYRHFTPVPYFPHFRRGRTIGIVESLIGPQEMLNKVSSQELHVINTTANSGWKVRQNALSNMTPAELEERGAETGLVIEVQGDPDKDIVKIQPNQIPSGLDRLSYKAEEHIKTISGVTDYRMGSAREDVSAKAVRANQSASSATTAKVLDNLRRTDYILARNVLDLVQQYYTEERLLFITKDRYTQEQAPVTINQVTPEGEIVNDLTIGEYAVVVTSEPERDTMEDTQFDQAMLMREKGVTSIPDDVIVQSSRLRNKEEVIKRMRAASESPEAQAMKALELRGKEAEVSKLESEAQNKISDAKLKEAKAASEGGQGMDGAQEFNIEKYKIDREMELEKYKADRKLELERELGHMKIEVQKQEAMAKRAEAVHSETVQ